MEKNKKNFQARMMANLERLDAANLRIYLRQVVKEKKFVEGIFDSLREGIIVIDSELCISSINSAACSLFGINENPVGQPIGKYLKQFAWEALLKIPDNAWGSFSRQEMEIFYPEHRYLNFYLRPVPERPDHRKRHLPLATLIFHDVTESYQANEQQVESQRVKAITQLAAGVAHELGNPLNSISLRLQILRRKAPKFGMTEKSEQEFFSHLTVLEQEVSRLDSIIKNFLNAVRPEKLQLSQINLGELLTKALEFMHLESEAHQIAIQLSLPQHLPPVQGDAGQLTQAFYNIIKNAIQAMPDGGSLDISCGLDDNFVNIKFADTGKGMSESDIAHIMEPFYTTKSSGTGLGLLIVDRIVRSHGGTLGIEGQPGKGACFTISLPRLDRRVKQLAASSKVACNTIDIK